MSTGHDSAEVVDVDPFDLPEVLGTQEVVWVSDDGIGSGHLVRGSLCPHDADPVPCDLFAVDEAYPAPVARTELRHRTHQAWRHGQVHVVRVEGRLTLAVPGTGFSADRVLDAVGRLAKAVGAAPSRFSVQLRLGR